MTRPWAGPSSSRRTTWRRRTPPDLRTFAEFTPLYGLSQLVHYPLVGGTLQWGWILNLVVWLAIFVVGAAWRLRRDTARV